MIRIPRKTEEILRVLSLLLVATLGTDAIARDDINEVAQSQAAVDRFLNARAAAEVCYGRPLMEEESVRFFKSLSYRDGDYRSPERLARETEESLVNARDLVRKVGCGNHEVTKALRDWNLRVTLYTGIDFNEPVIVEPIGTDHQQLTQIKAAIE